MPLNNAKNIPISDIVQPKPDMGVNWRRSIKDIEPKKN
jgi:hypothetical protein